MRYRNIFRIRAATSNGNIDVQTELTITLSQIYRTGRQICMDSIHFSSKLNHVPKDLHCTSSLEVQLILYVKLEVVATLSSPNLNKNKRQEHQLLQLFWLIYCFDQVHRHLVVRLYGSICKSSSCTTTFKIVE